MTGCCMVSEYQVLHVESWQLCELDYKWQKMRFKNIFEQNPISITCVNFSIKFNSYGLVLSC